MSLRLSVLAAVALLTALPAAFAQQGALVSVDPVVSQDFTRTVPVLGRLVTRQAGAVASRISGPVDRVHFEPGDRVRAGALLVSLNADALALRRRQAQALLTEAEARLETARAQLIIAEQEVRRLAGLAGTATVSEADYDDARQQRNIATARVHEAEVGINSSRAALEFAELELGYVRITAPFDGTITAKLTEIGSYLQPGQAVAEMLSDHLLELEADVPAALLPGLVASPEVELLLDNGSRHGARLRAIIPEESPRTRTRRVRFETRLGADAGPLANEQSATVLVPASAARAVLTVHKDAIIRRGPDSFVYIVADADGGQVAELRPIVPGEAIGERIEVTRGAAAGEAAVIRGNERLAPGQPVQVATDS